MECAPDLTQWLDELLRAIGLNKPHLMAHSYGGWQPALYTRDHSEELASLILLSPAGTILPLPKGLFARAILDGLLPFRAYTKYYLYWYDPVGARDDRTRWIIDELIEDSILVRRCYKHRNFIRPTVLSDEDWHCIKVPILFLVGEDDVRYSAEEAIAKLHRVAPEFKTAIAPGADHHLTIVKPDWLIDKVLKFLSDQESGKQSAPRPRH